MSNRHDGAYPERYVPPVKAKRRRGRIVAIVGASVAVVVVLGALAANYTPRTTGSSPAAAPVATVTITLAVPGPAVTTVTAPAPPPVTVTYTPPKPAGLTAGIYSVGGDIEPGRYVTEGSDGGCYFARLKNDSGGLDSIIANNNLAGRGSVTVRKGEFLELNGSCEWVLQK